MTTSISTAFIADKKHFFPTIVSICSLLENRKGSASYKVYLFTDFELNEHESSIVALRRRYPDCEIVTRHHAPDEPDVLGGRLNSISGTAFIKYTLCDLLPDVDKLLYLSSQTLIQRDLLPLYETELEDNYFAAVPALIKYQDKYHLRRHSEKVGVSLNDYLDTNVMLLNLSRMRRDGIALKLLEYAKNDPKLLFGEQDAFNAICKQAVVSLPRSYNLTTDVLRIPSLRSEGLRSEDAAILQYSGRDKPWKTTKAVWSSQYLAYLRKSPAKGHYFQLLYDQGKSDLSALALKPVRKLLRFADRRIRTVEDRFRRVQRREQTEDLYASSMQHFLLDQVLHGTASGVNDGEPRSPKIIVSLTTIPSRLHEMVTTIEALLRQTLKPDAIILWLDETRASEASLPISIQRQQARGLTVRFCEDIGPHTKLIPALKCFPDDVIITVDDDILYPMDLVERLVAEYRADPGKIYCNRARFISPNRGRDFSYTKDWANVHSELESINVFPLGVGGVLYPPGVLDKQVFDLGLQRELAPFADDIWFKAMSLRRKVICKRIATPKQRAPTRPFSQDVALQQINVDHGGNEQQVRACFDHFDLWPLLLVKP